MTMSNRLNHNQARFVAEYLAVLPRCATEAYLRVFDCDRISAHTNASRMLAMPAVRAEVERRENELRADLALTAEDVLREVALVAMADPRELTEHYRGACRHCWGIEFKYQRRPSEYLQDFDTYRATAAGKDDPFGANFPVMGGVGFTTRKTPNADCPECDGNGESYEVFKDTRNLSPAAARLFDGVERTKDGLKLKIRDRSKCLELAAQHLGIARRSVDLTAKVASVSAVSFAGVDSQTAATIYQSLVGGA